MESGPLIQCPVCSQVDAIQIDSVLSEPNFQLWQSRLGRALDRHHFATDYRIFRCSVCTLEFSDPMEPGSTGFYDAITSKFAGNRWEFGQAISLVEQFGDNCLLLDVGCGAGNFLKRVPKNVNAVGVDTSPEQIREAKDAAPNARLYCGMLDSLSESFDLVTMFHVVEHVPDPVSIITDAMAILSSQGKILFSVPLSPTQWDVAGFEDPYNFPPHHLTRWNLKAIRTLAEVVGLSCHIVEQPIRPWRWRLKHTLTARLTGSPNWNVTRTQFVKQVLRHPLITAQVGMAQSKLRSGNTALVLNQAKLDLRFI